MIISEAKSLDISTTDSKEKQEQKLCYIYRHIRLDKNEVFYIGKGTNTDGKYERANSRCDRNPHWHNIVNKHGYKIEIIEDNLSEKVALGKEIELILHYGRIDLGTGTLVNKTDGGEGSSGFIVSIETRKKMSESRRGNTNMLGKKQSSESIEKRIKANTGKKRTEEQKKNISNGHKKKKVGQYKEGILLNEYPSINSVKLDGFLVSSVSRCCNNKYGFKFHQGFEWKFL